MRWLPLIPPLPDNGSMPPGTWRHAYVSTPLRELPRVQTAVARAEAAMASVRAYPYDTVTLMWDAAVEDRVLDPEQEARRYLATAYAAEICLEVVESMYRLAGATAIQAASPLER